MSNVELCQIEYWANLSKGRDAKLWVAFRTETIARLQYRTRAPFAVEGVLCVGEFDVLDASTVPVTNHEFPPAVSESEQRFQGLVQNAFDVFAIVDEHGTYTYISNAVSRVLGFRPEELNGQNLQVTLHPEERDHLVALFSNLVASPNATTTIEMRNRHANGSWIDCEVVAQNCLHIPSIHGVVLTYRDITERKQAQALIRHMAYHDQLTNLPNRRAFDERLRSAIEDAGRRGGMVFVMYLDFDRFKFVNDTFGHSMGDQILIQFGQRIAGSLGPDDMIARLGGDEFALLFPTLNRYEQSAEIARDILEGFETAFHVAGYTFSMTASIGIAAFPGDGTDAESLIKHADIALYRAKDLGRNQYQAYASTMNIQSQQAFTIQNDLRRIFEKDQLVVHYQPRVRPLSGEIVGAEALIRWQHPEWGMIFPNDFLPLLDEATWIKLGAWVLQSVCAQNKAWQDAGYTKIPISVNFAGQQLMQEDLVHHVQHILDETGLNPQWLEIEITEDSIRQHEEVVVHEVNKLQDLGISVAVDDFGTGYSSLSRLTRFSFDTLKIDQSFVQNIGANAESATIVETIIQLARTLGMHVVAEGVEEERQLQFLRDKGCPEVQGYLYSPAVSSESFERLLRQGRLDPVVKASQATNRRKYYRIKLNPPIPAELAVVTGDATASLTGSYTVLIQDIGADGLCFASTAQLPVEPNIMLTVTTTALSELDLRGHIVWHQESDVDRNLTIYGLEFQVDDTGRAAMAAALRRLKRKQQAQRMLL